jgi:hypothetical protein
MAPVATTTPTIPASAPPHGAAHSKRTALLLIVAAAAVCVGLLLWSHWWPFEPSSVIKNLQEASDSQVQIGNFQRTYFPHPGCILTDVRFLHGGNAAPLITVEKLTIEGSYLGILARHINRITAQGMHVLIPAFGSGQTFHTTRSSLTVGEIVADGATLDFASHDRSSQPLRFEIHEGSFSDVGWSGPLTYRLKLHNPNPPGEITATGKFGVWDENNPAQTPVSGVYQLEHADLSIYRGIAGLLSSNGKFTGNLGHIDISGTTDTPDFEVTMGRHPTRLITEFTAYVDATHGDTFLQRVDAHFRKTRVIAKGSIAKSANGNGKTTLIELSTTGRIEDVLGLFVKKARAPMSGEVTLRAKVKLPPGDDPFLERVVLEGRFGIDNGEFSQPATQEGVNKLSAGARGEKESSDPETALNDLTGQVTLHGGTAKFGDLSFGVPGASARLNGTYNVISHKIDLRGQMQVETKISNTTSGAKAFLLKMMDPFFKKRKRGEILPVRISGSYESPSFGLDIEDEKAEHVAPPAPPRQ